MQSNAFFEQSWLLHFREELDQVLADRVPDSLRGALSMALWETLTEEPEGDDVLELFAAMVHEVVFEVALHVDVDTVALADELMGMISAGMQPAAVAA